MSAKQWGHGFHTGKKDGEYWGEMLTNGKWQIELSELSARLHILSNALSSPSEQRKERTGLWWEEYTRAIAKEIKAIATELPGTLNGVIEFTEDM